jgi:hypothetical protein
MTTTEIMQLIEAIASVVAAIAQVIFVMRRGP